MSPAFPRPHGGRGRGDPRVPVAVSRARDATAPGTLASGRSARHPDGSQVRA